MSTTLKLLWTSAILGAHYSSAQVFYHENYKEYLMTEREGIDININI